MENWRKLTPSPIFGEVVLGFEVVRAYFSSIKDGDSSFSRLEHPKRERAALHSSYLTNKAGITLKSNTAGIPSCNSFCIYTLLCSVRLFYTESQFVTHYSISRSAERSTES